MENQFKKVLFISGWFNIIAGTCCILFFKMFFKTFYNIVYNPKIYGSLLLNHILMFAFIAIIGVGLIKSSKNIMHGKILIQISAYGKLYAALTFVISIFKDHYTYLFFVPAIIDGALAMYFLYSLKKLSVNE